MSAESEMSEENEMDDENEMVEERETATWPAVTSTRDPEKSESPLSLACESLSGTANTRLALVTGIGGSCFVSDFFLVPD